MKEMSESELYMEKLKSLLNTYVELLRLHTDPGEKSHALWHSIDFIKRQIREILR